MHRLVSFRVQKNVRKAVDFLASTEDWQMPGRCRRMPHGVASAWQVSTDAPWCGKCLAGVDGCPHGAANAWPPADAMGAGKCPIVLRKRPALFCRLQDLFQFLRR